MNHFSLYSYLSSNVTTSPELLQGLLQQFKVKQVTKGSYLLKEGDKCRHVFYVEKGLLRQYTIDVKGKEHIIQFAPERWFISDRESTYFDEPSSYFIQALEDSKVVFLDEEAFMKLMHSSEKFITFNNRLLHNHIRQLQRRINGLLSATAEERYLDFIELYPDILLRVPQSMVASYLGIAPESLSRIRKQLAGQHNHTS